MEFADWIVSGLDQLRTGNLPGGQPLYQAVSAGLGGHPVVDAFMNTGDPAARAQLVQLIAQTAATNPGFEQQLRGAAAASQGGGAPAKMPFLKTTNGIVVLVVAAVLVVGGGVGLALGLSGGSSDKSSGTTGGVIGGTGGSGGGGKLGGGGSLANTLKGTWNCGGSTLTIGDGTWSVGSDSGTWMLNGGKATITSKANPGDDITATNVPSGPGAFDILASSPGHGSTPEPPAHVKGLISAHELNVQFSAADSDTSPSITCKK